MGIGRYDLERETDREGQRGGQTERGRERRGPDRETVSRDVETETQSVNIIICS